MFRADLPDRSNLYILLNVLAPVMLLALGASDIYYSLQAHQSVDEDSDGRSNPTQYEAWRARAIADRDWTVHDWRAERIAVVPAESLETDLDSAEAAASQIDRLDRAQRAAIMLRAKRWLPLVLLFAAYSGDLFMTYSGAACGLWAALGQCQPIPCSTDANVVEFAGCERVSPGEFCTPAQWCDTGLVPVPTAPGMVPVDCRCPAHNAFPDGLLCRLDYTEYSLYSSTVVQRRIERSSALFARAGDSELERPYSCVPAQKCAAYSLSAEYAYGDCDQQLATSGLGAGVLCSISCTSDWVQVGADGNATCPADNTDSAAAQQNVFPDCVPRQVCNFAQLVPWPAGTERYSVTSADCVGGLEVSQSYVRLLQLPPGQQCTLTVQCPDGYGTARPGDYLESRVEFTPRCPADNVDASQRPFSELLPPACSPMPVTGCGTMTTNNVQDAWNRSEPASRTVDADGVLHDAVAGVRIDLKGISIDDCSSLGAGDACTPSCAAGYVAVSTGASFAACPADNTDRNAVADVIDWSALPVCIETSRCAVPR